MFSLQGKTAVITGGASGIGKSIARLFAAQGAQVHALDLSKEGIDSMIREAGAVSGKLSGQVVDVSQQKQVDQAIAALASVQILVNCAGVSHIGKADTTTEADLDRIIAVNVKGVYNCLHAVIPRMKKQGGGVILNICSVAALVGLPDRFAYSMSKGAVYAMTLSVAKDYLPDHIRCNSISPGRVHTSFIDGYLKKHYPGQEAEMFDKLAKTQPIGRMGQPDEIATLALYLCSDEAAFITGTDYPIDGGFVKLNT
ncbi:MAG: SDR family NAD(P)-dependent oxidoreductase [Chitinophagaceae bacterium]